MWDVGDMPYSFPPPWSVEELDGCMIVWVLRTANCCLARSWTTRCRGRAIWVRYAFTVRDFHPLIASSAILALNSAENRLRVLIAQ